MFNPGDVVQLKSGGQAMTVVRVDNGEVELVWQDMHIRGDSRQFILDEGEVHMGIIMPESVLMSYVSRGRLVV